MTRWIVLLVLTGTLLAPATATACSCLRISAQYYYDTAEVVFVARAHGFALISVLP